MSDDPRKEPDEKTTQKRPATQPAMQAQPVTRQLPAMTDRALLEDLARMTREVAGDVKMVRGDLDLLMGDVGTLKVDVRELQRWKIDTEDRGSTHSGGIRQLTGNDQKQDAAIASIIVTQEEHTEKFGAIEKKLETNTAVTVSTNDQLTAAFSGFWKRNPKIETALVAFLIVTIGAAGLAIQALVKHL